MSDTKISAFASGSPAQNGDVIVVARGGANFKLTLAQVLTAGLAATFGATTLGATVMTGPNVSVVARVTSATGDRLRVQPLAAGSGVIVDATNAAESVFATLFLRGSSVQVDVSDLTVSRVNIGGNVASITYNGDNTNAASNAIVQSLVQGASGGDPMTWWNVNGITNWAAGIDNSDADKWKLSASTALGTNDCITVTTAGVVTATLGDFGVSRASVGGNVVSQSFNSDNTNGASHAYLNVTSGGASGGDPTLLWNINGLTVWSAGIDNSDADKWKLSQSVTLGTNDVLVVDTSKRAYWMARVSEAQGAAVASANNLVLGSDGNRFQITGTTTINLIDFTSWQGGSRVVLHFQGSLTVSHNVAASGNNKPIMLAGAANFSATASDQLELQYDSTDSKWYEVGRTVI